MRLSIISMLLAVGLVAAFADRFPPLPLVSYRPQANSSSSTLNTSLIAYWKLDEASGTRVDSEPTGTPQDLTDNNTVNQTNGVIGSSAWFISANTESLSRTDSSDLSISGSSFTVAAWVQVSSLATQQDVATKYNTSGNREYIVRVNTTGSADLVLSTNGTAVITVSTNSAVTANTWVFIVAGVDASGLMAFISANGGGKIGLSIAASAIDSAANFVIGSRQSGGALMNGFIDEVGFWKKALSASEITELYNSGSGKTCCPF